MRTSALLVLAMAVASNSATGQQTVDRRRPASSDGTVKITNSAGSIRVIGWNRDTVAISGTLGVGIERLDFLTDERATRIHVVPSRTALDRAGMEATGILGSDLEIHVPRRSYVAVRTVGALIEISDIEGGVDLASESGDIHIGGEFVQSVYAETAGGDIRVDAQTKVLRASSLDGTVTVSRARGFVEISTVSGNVRLSGRGLAQGQITSVSGDIWFEGGFERGGLLFSFETHSGSIELRLPPDVAAEFEVSAISGRVENEFAPASASAFSTGGRGARVKVTSFKGRVSILKRR